MLLFCLIFSSVCVLFLDNDVSHALPPPLPLPLSELLSIQSAEENEFVLKYSPEVWKGTVNVWLGMYYDTNSEYRVTGAPTKVEIQHGRSFTVAEK